jgi:ABC-type Fe3+/spermidine/putrescine transport system ATPase subunit
MGMTTGTPVRVRGAVKRYGAAAALAGIDLDVSEGQFAVLLGPSGSGKSTLARVLAGIERVDSGMEFTGRVAWTDGEFLDVDVEGRPLRARVIGTAETGDTARLLVRPAATRFLAAHTGQTQNAVTGTVTDVAYRGRGYDHVVTTASGTLAGVFDQHAWPRGTEVQVALDPDGCTAHTTDQLAEVSYATDLTAVSNES